MRTSHSALRTVSPDRAVAARLDGMPDSAATPEPGHSRTPQSCARHRLLGALCAALATRALVRPHEPLHGLSQWGLEADRHRLRHAVGSCSVLGGTVGRLSCRALSPYDFGRRSKTPVIWTSHRPGGSPRSIGNGSAPAVRAPCLVTIPSATSSTSWQRRMEQSGRVSTRAAAVWSGRSSAHLVVRRTNARSCRWSVGGAIGKVWSEAASAGPHQVTWQLPLIEPSLGHFDGRAHEVRVSRTVQG